MSEKVLKPGGLDPLAGRREVASLQPASGLTRAWGRGTLGRLNWPVPRTCVRRRGPAPPLAASLRQLDTQQREGAGRAAGAGTHSWGGCEHPWPRHPQRQEAVVRSEASWAGESGGEVGGSDTNQRRSLRGLGVGPEAGASRVGVGIARGGGVLWFPLHPDMGTLGKGAEYSLRQGPGGA